MIWGFWIDSVPISRGVLDGTTSLGGSESACIGLMRALARRGHTVHAFTPKLEPDAVGDDGQGVAWHLGTDFHGHPVWLHTDWDVFVGLRMPYSVGGTQIPARWRILWNQDLLFPAQADATMGALWQTDTVAYVSQFHRTEWEALVPGVKPLGWVTKNGYDPTCVPTGVVKRPNRVIHISRPERALVRVVRDGKAMRVDPGPLLQMWPAVRGQRPDAELHLCRYSSMYDAGGWGEICRAADVEVAKVAEAVGGIVYLGELGKPALYRAIAESAVMWYPGVVDFAETGCIAAVEAQACGTPFVGSFKGALPETAPHSVLVKGDASSLAYQAQSIGAVLAALDGCRDQTDAYRAEVEAGLRHVTPAYTYDALAAEWEAYVLGQFDRRSADKAAVLRKLLLWDDHLCARIVAAEMGQAEVVAFCDRVIAGEEQNAEDYADRAVSDPLVEIKAGITRLESIVPWYAESTRLLDVACGNGACALKLLTTHPHLTVVGVDYAPLNIARAEEAAEKLGVADRATFVCLPIYDFGTHTMAPAFLEWLTTQAPFDAVFVGEFLEHVANAPGLIDGLEAACAPEALVGYTTPRGPFSTLMPRLSVIKRGHVHAFELDDLGRLFGLKDGLRIDALNAGTNKRGEPVGHWLVTYRVAPDRPSLDRDYAHRIRSTRPRPFLSALLITQNEAANLAGCLDTIWGLADEIVIGDTGSVDETVEIARRYDARVLELPYISARDGFDFSDARNAVLDACRGEWVLWIDADETLEGGSDLGKYLESGPFIGYAIAQVHLALDAPVHQDLPVRCFRRVPEIRWFGSIHEQPQFGEANADIFPALQLPDVKIAHRGYRTLHLRNSKRKRNLPLLDLDRKRYPERRLGLVLWLRDLVQEAEEHIEAHGKRLTDRAARYLTEAIDVFETELNTPGDKLYPFARPWYERAVMLTKEPWEFAYTLVGQRGGLNGTKPLLKKVWVRQPGDIESVIRHELAELERSLITKPIIVDPPSAEATDDELAPERSGHG